nr:transporter [Bradyrhizobium jicamae]
MFDQFVTAQGSITGPNVPTGPKTSVSAAAVGFLFVPGWTFLGATYDAVIVQPAFSSNISAPVNFQAAAVHNTYVVPAELSWKLGDSGFFVKTGLGIYVPDGDILGANGLASIGNPWWTFQPEFIVSYLKDGWNLTANIFQEFNTKNQRTGYRTGDIFHAEFVATKRFDKWTLGPVGYVVSQVSNDQSSAFYNFAVNSNRYTKVAAGGLVGYDFGPVALNVWATNEFYSTASGKTPSAGVDLATVTHAWSAFASISYRLWAPDDGAAPRRLLPTK